MTTKPSKQLETFDNATPDRDYTIRIRVPEFTCLVGTMTQEVYGSHPAIRDACAASIFGHAATLEPDIEAAMKARGIAADWTPASLAAHTQAVLQGAFILAKATGEHVVARESVDHLKRYLLLLFGTASSKETAVSRGDV